MPTQKGRKTGPGGVIPPTCGHPERGEARGENLRRLGRVVREQRQRPGVDLREALDGPGDFLERRGARGDPDTPHPRSADRAGGEGERSATRQPERGEALHAELVDDLERTVRHVGQSERSGRRPAVTGPVERDQPDTGGRRHVVRIGQVEPRAGGAVEIHDGKAIGFPGHAHLHRPALNCRMRAPSPPQENPTGAPRSLGCCSMDLLQKFPPQVLREYALLADGERGALIGPQGDLAWLCCPRWDSDAVFSTLIGGAGCYALTPRGRYTWGGYYSPRSLIWNSRWVMSDGVIESREAFALPADPHVVTIVRRIRSLERHEPDQGRPRCAGQVRRRSHARRPAGSEDGTWTGRSGPIWFRWTGVPGAHRGGAGPHERRNSRSSRDSRSTWCSN